MTVVEGVWQNGRVVLTAPPSGVAENAPVLVTFLAPGEVDLAAHGIGPEQAAELRASLAAFAEDWDAPDMNGYNDYDTARAGQP